MAKRQEPVRKSVRDVLEDIVAGHREAAICGPASALKYLRRTLEGQANLPNAAKAVVNDLLADAHGQLGSWAACAESVELVFRYLPELQAAFPHEYRRLIEGMTCFERGIQAHTELGDFRAALSLCDRAIALELGAHFAAKRQSLAWARDE
jgi:hypothetical protein